MAKKKETTPTIEVKEEKLKKSKKRIFFSLLGYFFMLIGLFFLAIFYFPLNSLPEVSQPLVKEIKTQINTTVDKTIQETTLTNSDSIVLNVGHMGGDQELELCDGTFTQYLSYEEAGLKPTYLAHNGCGGSILLYPKEGSIFTINFPDGTSKYYKLVDSRDIPQVGSTSDMISDLKGDVYFQTCYFDYETMRVVGLEEVNSDGSPLAEDNSLSASASESGKVKSLDLAIPSKE